MPDWTYRTLLRPILFSMPAGTAHRMALRSLGTLIRMPLGHRVLEFFGHMQPDRRAAYQVRGMEFLSRTAIGSGLDPAGEALGSFRRFGVAVVEVGPLEVRPPGESPMMTRVTPNGCSLRCNRLDPSSLVQRMEPTFASLAQVWLRIEAGFPLPLMEGTLKRLGTRVSGITLSGWEATGTSDRIALAQSFRDLRLPWMLSVGADPAAALGTVAVQDAVRHGAVGVWFRSDSRQADGSVRVKATDLPSLTHYVGRLRNEFGPEFILVAGGARDVGESLALCESGADLVGLEFGMVFSGPGLPKRVNEALLSVTPTSSCSADDSPEQPGSMAWTWGLLLGVSMVLGGLLAIGIASTRVVLPYDEAFCGMDLEQLKALNPRLLPFLSHDRVTLAGTMLSAGVLYTGLAWHGIRRGLHWAKVALVVSALSGFFSFFLFLGFGYFDPFHAFVTAVLFQFLLLLIHSPIAKPSDPGPPEIEENAAWIAGLWGQLLMVTLGIGLVVAGAVISLVGAGPVLVREDLEFLATTREALLGSGRRLMPLIAHDRASLGGMLIACGLGVWLTAQWGFRIGRSWLWWTLALAGTPAFVAAIGIHLIVGYSDPLHLAPAIGGAVWFGVALGLSRKWLCGPRLAAGTAFSSAPK